ncbi:MAG: hypothetical protein ACK4ZJ_14325, partial [Allorhizobium sp.]
MLELIKDTVHVSKKLGDLGFSRLADELLPELKERLNDPARREAAYVQFKSQAPDLLTINHDRKKVKLRDQGARHDIIDPVLTPEADDL